MEQLHVHLLNLCLRLGIKQIGSVQPYKINNYIWDWFGLIYRPEIQFQIKQCLLLKVIHNKLPSRTYWWTDPDRQVKFKDTTRVALSSNTQHIRFWQQRAADWTTNLKLCDMDSLVAYLKENDILSVCSGPLASCFRTSTCSWGCGRAGQDAKAEAAATFQPGQATVDQHRVTLVEANPHVDVTQRYQHFRPSTPRGCSVHTDSTYYLQVSISCLKPTSAYVISAVYGCRPWANVSSSAPLRNLRFHKFTSRNINTAPLPSGYKTNTHNRQQERFSM